MLGGKVTCSQLVGEYLQVAHNKSFPCMMLLVPPCT